MLYNLRIEKSIARTHEVVKTDGIITTKWEDVCKFWKRNRVHKYEDIENCMHYLKSDKGYDLFCNTDAMFGDGLLVNIKGSAKDI